jgi:phosphoglycerol transferase MdoB-like AlkP superfamily enzyme
LIVKKYIGRGIVINADSILSILGTSLILTIMSVLIICVPAGIYWLFKRKLLPGFYKYIWILWGLLIFIYTPQEIKMDSPVVPRLSNFQYDILCDLSVDKECLSTLEFFQKESTRLQAVDALEALLKRNYIKLPPDVVFNREALLSEPDDYQETEYRFGLTDDGYKVWEVYTKTFYPEKVRD